MIQGRRKFCMIFFSELELKPDEIIELSKEGEIVLSVYTRRREQADRIRRKLRQFKLKNVVVSRKALKKQDWQTVWKKDFKPFPISKTFDVVPTWLKTKHKLKKSRQPVYIDTSIAFGTGMHATTRFMAQFVERCKGRYKSFFDIGTGTGILSIMASKCGAEDVHAIDISAGAIKVARQNMADNDAKGIKFRAVDFTKHKVNRSFDFVVANLVTQDLVHFKNKILQCVKPNQYLAVSGISLNGYASFREAFDPLPLHCLKIEKGEGWVGVLYKHVSRKR